MSLKPTNTVVEVDRDAFTLRLFKRGALASRFEFVKRYDIAIGFYDGPGGEPDYKTPRGFYCVLRKAKDPDWLMPNSAWVAPEDRGKTIQGGDPRNPIVSRWIELGGGVGIHGTRDELSIGTPASHGCIRMLKKDVNDLYDRVPRGSVVYVS